MRTPASSTSSSLRSWRRRISASASRRPSSGWAVGPTTATLALAATGFFTLAPLALIGIRPSETLPDGKREPPIDSRFLVSLVRSWFFGLFFKEVEHGLERQRIAPRAETRNRA